MANHVVGRKKVSAVLEEVGRKGLDPEGGPRGEREWDFPTWAFPTTANPLPYAGGLSAEKLRKQ